MVDGLASSSELQDVVVVQLGTTLTPTTVHEIHSSIIPGQAGSLKLLNFGTFNSRIFGNTEG